jgi:CRP-like cAMP-binding protein
MHRDVFDDDEDEDEVDDDDNMPKVLLDLGTRRTSMGDIVDDGYSSSSNNNNTNNPSSAAAAASMTTTTTTTTMNDDSANKRVSLMRRASSKMINCGTTGGNNNGGLATTPSNNSIGGNFIRNIHSDPIQQIESIIQYWEPPVHQKSKSDEEFITLALQRNFVFANALSDETISRKRELTLIVNAFEYYTVSEGGVTILDSTTVGDHFYILKEGSVDYMSSIDTTTTTTTTTTSRSSSGRKKVKVGQASRPGQSFGELCLLYNCPPPADCVSGPKGEGQVALYNTSCNLWRIHKQTFRYIMALRTIRQDEWLRNAVRTKIDIFLGLDDDFINRIANAFDVRSVKCDEVIYRSGDKSDEYYIVGSGDGTVKITLDGSNNKNDNKKSLTKIIGSGEVFGIDAISGCGGHAPSSSYRRAETAIATSATTLLVMSREQLDRTIGSLTDAKLVSRDRKLLKSIPLFRDSDFEDFEYELLAALIEPRTYKKNHIMYEEEDIINEPALYIVRDGTLEQLSDKFEDREKVLKEGDIFGEDSLLPDKTGKFGGPKGGQLYREETVEVISNVATCGKLTLSNIDSIILDLHRLGCNRRRNRSDPNVVGLKESMLVKDSHPVMLEQLEYHQLFGAGTFGRVWIVSKQGDHKIAYALKIQSKRALLDHKQASSALRERMVMEKLDHPFLCRLVNTFQDNEHIYMLLSLIQGGELLNLIQGGESYGGLPEIATKFYAATIVEGLSYMHRRHIVYRDLKPENVLVDSHGYAVIVDFGFAKVVRDKTYTFCGTPLCE